MKHRRAIIERLGPLYEKQEANRINGEIKESFRPAIVRVSPQRVMAFALIRILNDSGELAVPLDPIPRVVRECRIQDTSLDFRTPEELVEMWDWCEKVLKLPGDPYQVLTATLDSFKTSIDKQIRKTVPDLPDEVEVVTKRYGDYTLDIEGGDATTVKDASGNEVGRFSSERDALRWIADAM